MLRRLVPSLALGVALAVVGVTAGGCALSASDASGEAPNDDLQACAADTDCVLAGASCCACPDHAVAVGNAFSGACEGVECPVVPPSDCAPLVARCDDGVCVAACAPVACDLVCQDGFVADAGGCLTCACGGGDSPACAVDDDCVQAPADCCGCARGGVDTAVPAAGLEAHLAGLMCGGDESCPGVSTCTAGAAPRCQVGRCVLVAPESDPGAPAGACGRPDLPPCPPGEACVLNDSDDASTLGVGVCRPVP